MLGYSRVKTNLWIYITEIKYVIPTYKYDKLFSNYLNFKTILAKSKSSFLLIKPAENCNFNFAYNWLKSPF